MIPAAYRALALLFLLVTALCTIAGDAAANVCLGLSLAPPCCPSPCLIFDATRLPVLQGLTNDAVVSAGLEGKTSQFLGATATALASGVATTQFSWSGNFLSGPPGASAEPVPPATSSATTLVQYTQSLAAAFSNQQVIGLTVSLQHIDGLANLVAPATGQSPPPPSDIHGSLATAAGTRLKILADVLAMDQLWTASLAVRAAHAAQYYPVPGTAKAGPSLSLVAVAPTSLQNAPTQPLPLAVAPQQRAAQAILERYPALQRTVQIASVAQQIQGTASEKLANSLAAAGLDAGPRLPEIQSALVRLDRTGWQDAANKTNAAESAANRLFPQLTERLGSRGPSPDSKATLQQSMAAWLDAHKQALYWRTLSADAQAEISLLDQRLGEISDRVGFDITDPAFRRAGAVQ